MWICCSQCVKPLSTHSLLFSLDVYCFPRSWGPESVSLYTDQRADSNLDRWPANHRANIDIKSLISSLPDLHVFGLCQETGSPRGNTEQHGEKMKPTDRRLGLLTVPRTLSLRDTVPLSDLNNFLRHWRLCWMFSDSDKSGGRKQKSLINDNKACDAEL